MADMQWNNERARERYLRISTKAPEIIIIKKNWETARERKKILVFMDIDEEKRRICIMCTSIRGETEKKNRTIFFFAICTISRYMQKWEGMINNTRV